MRCKYKVLIVDNDDQLLSRLKNMLEQESYEVEITRSPVDALKKIKEDKYHIVLADIDMPEMNGIELLKEIKSYDALTQVIVMSEKSTMDKILVPSNTVQMIISIILSKTRSMSWRLSIIPYRGWSVGENASFSC